MGSGTTGTGKSKETHTFLRATITVAAVIAIGLRVAFPEFYQRIDSVGVALFVVAVIPWLSPIISKISVAGIEAELREIKQDIEETKDDLASAAKIAFRSQNVALLSGTDRNEGVEARTGSSQILIELGQKYTALRKSMPRGAARTTAMDKLFGDMVREASRMGNSWREHEDALRSDDAGQQLAAIAYSFASPEASNISSLIDAVENAKQPFVQYWGLRAIQRGLDADSEFSLKDMGRLENLTSAFGSGTDRFLIVSSIVRALRKKRT